MAMQRGDDEDKDEPEAAQAVEEREGSVSRRGRDRHLALVQQPLVGCCQLLVLLQPDVCCARNVIKLEKERPHARLETWLHPLQPRPVVSLSRGSGPLPLDRSGAPSSQHNFFSLPSLAHPTLSYLPSPFPSSTPLLSRTPCLPARGLPYPKLNLLEKLPETHDAPVRVQTAVPELGSQGGPDGGRHVEQWAKELGRALCGKVRRWS